MLAADGVHQGHKLRVRDGCLLLARAVHIMGKRSMGATKLRESRRESTMPSAISTAPVTSAAGRAFANTSRMPCASLAARSTLPFSVRTA